MNDSPPEQARLLRLYRLRWYAIAAQALVLFASKWGLEAALPMPTLFAVLALLSVINGLTAFRLRIPHEASDWEFAGHLLVDITGLASLLYFTGGATNPFISLLLLPLAIGAASLQIATSVAADHL